MSSPFYMNRFFLTSINFSLYLFHLHIHINLHNTEKIICILLLTKNRAFLHIVLQHLLFDFAKSPTKTYTNSSYYLIY